MNIRESIANYKLGNSVLSDFPKIAIDALEKGYDSESLVILAGLNSKTNSFEIKEYLESSLFELGIKIEDEFDSFIVLSKYYTNQILTGEVNSVEGTYKLKNNCIDNCSSIPDSKDYLLDGINFQKAIGLWYEFYEISDNEWANKEKKRMDEENQIKLLRSEIENWDESYLNREFLKVNSKNYLLENDEFCPCCLYEVFDNKNRFEYSICPICFWEDDPIGFNEPFYMGGANRASLIQARRNFELFGACEMDMKRNTRKPFVNEKRKTSCNNRSYVKP